MRKDIRNLAIAEALGSGYLAALCLLFLYEDRYQLAFGSGLVAVFGVVASIYTVRLYLTGKKRSENKTTDACDP